MNKQDWKGVENSCSYAGYSDGIFEIVDKERKEYPINETYGIENRSAMIAICCFNYGVMIGKRLDRAKRRGIINNER